jgi:hypothetical protein
MLDRLNRCGARWILLGRPAEAASAESSFRIGVRVRQRDMPRAVFRPPPGDSFFRSVFWPHIQNHRRLIRGRMMRRKNSARIM